MKFWVEVFWALPIVVVVGVLLAMAITYPVECGIFFVVAACVGLVVWFFVAVDRLVSKRSR